MSIESGKQVRTFELAPTVQVQWDTILRWSADSRSLTFLDHHAGIDNIWAQPLDGGPAKALTNFTESNIFSFDWSHDGNLVTSRGLLTSDVVLLSDAGRLQTTCEHHRVLLLQFQSPARLRSERTGI